MFTFPALKQNTPAEVTLTIGDALRQVSSSDPFYIEITPLPACLPMFCYGNVDSWIARDGGRREEGWIVYEGWGGRYLKLIHHCLWRTRDGRLVDLTPSDEVRNLFLPDTLRNEGETIPPRYIALDHRSEVHKVIAFCEYLDRTRTEMFRRLIGGAKRRMRLDSSSETQLIRRPSAESNRGRNNPCPCRSGKKFKKCCLRKL